MAESIGSDTSLNAEVNLNADTGALAENTHQEQIVDESATNNEEADQIAAKLIGILVEGFTARENRKPSESELDELLAELTEERINDMLGGPAPETGTGIIEDKCAADGCSDTIQGPESRAEGSDADEDEEEENDEEEDEEEEGDENDASCGNKRKGSDTGAGTGLSKKTSQSHAPVFSWPSSSAAAVAAPAPLGHCAVQVQAQAVLVDGNNHVPGSIRDSSSVPAPLSSNAKTSFAFV